MKIADRVKRKDVTVLETKSWHGPVTGKLVDSEPASASELFARVMQLEERGMIVGDVSSGSVMSPATTWID
jgi:C-terminal processing protease CtpA/Prc